MDLRGEGSCLPDMPPEPFPDKTVLQDSNVLTRQGRSSADQYFRTRAWDRFDDADGTTFFCMRRTLATYDHASNSWKNTPDNAVPCPSSGFAQAFANLVRANSEACLIRALFSLGLAQPLLDLEKLLKLLDSYVLVAVGPFASQFWRRESLAGEANPHTQGFCAFCHEFCLHATCEHMHAAFLILGQLSLQRPVFPERSKPVPLFEQDPVEVLLPAALGGLSARGQTRPDPLDLPRENANLTAFLRAHNWILWNRPLQQQQMTVQQLSSLTFADLRLAAPTIPSGVLLQIQSAACEWMHREAETLESKLNKISSVSLAAVLPCLLRFAFA